MLCTSIEARAALVINLKQSAKTPQFVEWQMDHYETWNSSEVLP
jgi:hypothetical protein